MTAFWVAFLVVSVVYVGLFRAAYLRHRHNKKVADMCSQQKEFKR